MSKALRANLLLLLTALIWGVAFVAQDVAMDMMEPFTFNAARTLVAALALLPAIRLLDVLEKKRGGTAAVSRRFADMTPAQKRTLVIGGVCCGAALFVGSSLQQLGIRETSAGKAGFVTALYIVLVPLSGLFFRRVVRRAVWLAVLLCTAGLFLLCVTDTLSIGPGDLYLLLCAVAFTVHILLIDHFSPRTDCVRMSCLQFFVTAALCALWMVLTEHPSPAAVMQGWLPILYAGVLSGGMGYTLQMVAQRDTDPTVASLLMSLESVFAVLAGWVILGDVLSLRELAGCALMMAGIVLAQVPLRRRRERTLPAQPEA
ncbi:MAG: DMT family transporter [Candidatus Limiplasma sp.]|nr:DMT family transporter [Candidatus Limiplasma sp.]MEA5145893.1 DMT family transporter [Candidatus Limiplasma sp.]